MTDRTDLRQLIGCQRDALERRTQEQCNSCAISVLFTVAPVRCMEPTKNAEAALRRHSSLSAQMSSPYGSAERYR
ncbi:hypothetical protein Y032_0023g859 [Ancylostoma ceylanicum]|nr:hypothetical protein Y032_0023g859 [Ancylostoma ceylanicum]